jgi:hypothetical protein
MASKSAGVPCLLWPFWAMWKFISGIIALMGRMAALVIGFGLMVVGVMLTMTVIGAFIGVPLMALGLVLIVRSIF